MPRNLGIVACGTAAVVVLGVASVLVGSEPVTAPTPLGGPVVVASPRPTAPQDPAPAPTGRPATVKPEPATPSVSDVGSRGSASAASGSTPARRAVPAVVVAQPTAPAAPATPPATPPRGATDDPAPAGPPPTRRVPGTGPTADRSVAIDADLVRRWMSRLQTVAPPEDDPADASGTPSGDGSDRTRDRHPCHDAPGGAATSHHGTGHGHHGTGRHGMRHHGAAPGGTTSGGTAPGATASGATASGGPASGSTAADGRERWGGGGRGTDRDRDSRYATARFPTGDGRWWP